VQKPEKNDKDGKDGKSGKDGKTVKDSKVEKDQKVTKPQVPQTQPVEKLEDQAPPLDERAAAAYRARLGNIFDEAFGDGAGPILKRIQDSLLTYSESNSSSAEFVIRSYRKRYGRSDVAIRKMLSRGLRQPDSLNAILTNIKTEYGSREMQIYALSKLLALQRWQSQVILELSQEIQL